MGKIICLMGKSSSGKDTLYKHLMSDRELGLRPIVPYTTRPIRAGEQDGVEYYFTDEEGFRRLNVEGRIIEERSYRTVHGLWRYFTVADDKIDLEAADHCLIGTLDVYLSLRHYYGPERVLPVLVELDDGERLARALARSSPSSIPGMRRCAADFWRTARIFPRSVLPRRGSPEDFVMKI